jgi:hypothetical protein
MNVFKLRATFAAGLAVVALAQLDSETNTAVDISSCSDLDTVDTSQLGGVCYARDNLAIGVGVAANVFTVNDTSLSLTLLDSGLNSASGYEMTTQRLYVGTPPGVNPSEQPPACALMLQYQGQTFPNITGPSDNTTSCSDIFGSRGCLERLVEAVYDFEYAGGNDSSSSSSAVSQRRCDLLASHVRAWLMPQLSFCGVWTSFANITGGPIFGPDASTYPETLQWNGGEAVSPGDYTLHKVVSMAQFTRPGGDDFPDADSAEAGEDLAEPVRGAGRQGKTPVIGVFYRSEEDTRPEVEFACMRTFSPVGETLPNTLYYPKSSAAVRGVGCAAAMAVGAAFLHMFM